MAFVVLSSHWMCWGLGRQSLGPGTQQILLAAKSPCFPGKSEQKMIHQRLSARDPATNIRCVCEWDFRHLTSVVSWQDPDVRREREKQGFVPILVGPQPRGVGLAEGEECEGEGGGQASCIAEALPDALRPGYSMMSPLGSLRTPPEPGRGWHMRRPGGARIAALPALPAS